MILEIDVLIGLKPNFRNKKTILIFLICLWQWVSESDSPINLAMGNICLMFVF